MKNIVQLFQISTLEVCADFVADALPVEKPTFSGEILTFNLSLFGAIFQLKKNTFGG